MKIERYVPIIRTSEAELKAFQNLSPDVKRLITPFFELTRSRITSKPPFGDIYQNLYSILEHRPENFILDVTTEPKLENAQTERLYSPLRGYKAWVDFVQQLKGKLFLPVLLINENGHFDDLRSQAASLLKIAGGFVIRMGLDEKDYETYVAPIIAEFCKSGKILLVFDCGFVKVGSASLVATVADSLLANVKKASPEIKTLVSASSFPANVLAPGYGEEEEGNWWHEEVRLSELLNAHEFYSDYSGTHPFRYDGAGGWVPRIDVPLEREVFYKRVRREYGGYIAAARDVLDDDYYTSVGAWGDAEIRRAADGFPSGRSPSHWIGVRVNLHITRQVQRLYPDFVL